MVREVDEVPGLGRIAAQPRAEEVHRLMSQASFEAFDDLPITWRIIEVFNTGDAIPPERCDALFGKFELVGRIEHHNRGSGLSLPIAQSAVENHGGRICVHSVKLQGNSFYILLPTVATADLTGRRNRVEARGHLRLNRLSGDQAGHGIGGGTGDKNVGQMADPAALQVELHDQGATGAGSSDQTGGGVDGACGADDQKDVTIGGRPG